MCGIFGYLGTEAGNISHDKIVDLLHHRGPDGNGFVRLESVLLVHTRLSIIDLSPKGQQPISNCEKTVWVVCNGEIYNYIELKKQLSGYLFQTSTDTEVILAAYEKWGDEFIHKLRGMFSFGLYDTRENKLICAVDRFGIKPFYYYFDREKFIFSSEIKPLQEAGISLEPDDRTIFDYMAYGLLTHNHRTFFKSIKQLRPSQYIVYKDGNIKISQYWDLPAEDSLYRESNEDYVELADNKLAESLKLHLRSDVEYGLSLSAGLDSNLLRCMISEKAKLEKPLQCFSFCYSGTCYDECIDFRETKDGSGVKYNKSEITSENLFKDLPEIIKGQEGPIGGAGIYAFWHNMKLASDTGIKVVLNGQGADEIFCGYKYYYESWLTEIYEKGDIRLLKKELGLYNKEHGLDLVFPGKEFDQLMASSKNIAAVRAPDGTSLDAHGYLTIDFMKLYNNSIPVFPRKYNSNTKNSMYADLFYKKIPKLLRFQDKCSMHWGVEVRVPFLDHILAESIFPIPVGKLINNGITKSLMRDVSLKYKDSLQSSFSEKTKKYMPTPLREWLKYEQVEYIKDLINTSRLHDNGYINKRDLMKEYTKYIKQESLGNAFFIWKFINMEFLFNVFF